MTGIVRNRYSIEELAMTFDPVEDMLHLSLLTAK
jgi:hypothetical protein